MLYTWGGIVMLIIYGVLEGSGTIDFTATVWMLAAVTAVMTVAADVRRNRRPAVAEVRHHNVGVYTTR